MNKVNPFLALTALCPLIFLSNLSNTDEVALFANLGKTSLSKGAVRSNNTFVIKLPSVLPRNPPERIILDNCALLSFISVNLLLVKAFLILVFKNVLLKIIYVVILCLEIFS